jgi:hypothetical protein
MPSKLLKSAGGVSINTEVSQERLPKNCSIPRTDVMRGNPQLQPETSLFQYNLNLVKSFSFNNTSD